MQRTSHHSYLRVMAIRIIVHPTGENLTTWHTRALGQTTYGNLSQSSHEAQIASLQLGWSFGSRWDHLGPAVILGYLILLPFYQSWSSGYDSSKQLLSYICLLGPIYQHAVSIVQDLLNETNNGTVHNKHRRGLSLKYPHPSPQPSHLMILPFPLVAPFNLKIIYLYHSSNQTFDPSITCSRTTRL
jgi:hypothetical protein